MLKIYPLFTTTKKAMSKTLPLMMLLAIAILDDALARLKSKKAATIRGASYGINT